jgi:hypothetical protein
MPFLHIRGRGRVFDPVVFLIFLKKIIFLVAFACVCLYTLPFALNAETKSPSLHNGLPRVLRGGLRFFPMRGDCLNFFIYRDLLL